MSGFLIIQSIIMAPKGTDPWQQVGFALVGGIVSGIFFALCLRYWMMEKLGENRDSD